MKKLLLTTAFGFAVMATQELYAQQGFGTNTPDKSAAVDIVSTKRGLLIPRVNLQSTDNAAPVNSPANSLFVYNKATAGGGETAVQPGFYYWLAPGTAGSTGKWIRFVSSETEKKVTVTAGENVSVESEVSTDGLTTDYTVSIKAGDKEGLVLVTNADGGTEWVNPADFVYSTLVAGNGIGIERDTDGQIEVKFDGDLTENTIINTGGNTLAITGLQEVAAQDLATTDRIVMMDGSGVLKITSKSELLDAKDLTLGNGLKFESGDGHGAVLAETKIRLEAGQEGEVLTTVTNSEGDLVTEWANVNSLVEVDNGLSKVGDDGVIHLGGALIKPTLITATNTNTLGITGLEKPSESSEIVYVETGKGILRKVARSLSKAISTTENMATWDAYNAYVQEVTIFATIGSADLDLTFPKPSESNNGQVINVKIMNTQESDNYLNVRDFNQNVLTYGAMPYQGWIFKSTGNQWLIVGRN